MGTGAYMSVNNQNQNGIRTFVHDEVCMYDNGTEGSNLHYFNSLYIESGQTLPEGEGQYIEADASGTCLVQTSTFTLDVNVVVEGQESLLGSVTFQAVPIELGEWTNLPPTGSGVEPNITPPHNGDQWTIEVTVANVQP